MLSFLKRYKDWLGPAFVSFEAVMHVYLMIYLTLNWTNLLVWGFTAFELTMFLYLLVIGKDKHKKQPESLAVRHMRHYQYCGCLGDSAICCDDSCICEKTLPRLEKKYYGIQ